MPENAQALAPSPRARRFDKDAQASLWRMRHSCAHLMAAAVQDIWPEAKFGVGPPTANGFYYDVLFDEPIGEGELGRVEARMRELQAADLALEREELPVDEAIERMRAMGQDFKVELLHLLKERGTTAIIKETGDEDAVGVARDASGAESVSFYTLDDFVDLCRGPHVASTGEIGAFKLTQVAGAYWRGDERAPQLQRIYGLCFPSQEEIDDELWRIEQRKQRDHRKLGRELGIFTFAGEVGLGLPLWLPNGTVLRLELERLAREFEKRYGYEQVVTPQIARSALYYQSGHLPYYQEDMYPAMRVDEDEEFFLRPMNCPHHHHVYLARPRSYRELPYRVAEYGDVFRYEPHGALTGLMRTRSFCQNDAHLYCRFDQAKDEFLQVMRLHAEYYELFGIEDYYMLLALPDLERLDKYVDAPDKWLAALEVVRAAMDESGYPYVEAEGEAAFYGPKVDFMISSMIGTEYAISTNQLDFLATERFGLAYKGADDAEHPVYVIHRAPLGSHERFIAFLIEHYAGAFPTWLAPVQAVVIPISDRHLDYAEEVRRRLAAADVRTATEGLRVEVDASAERMQKKIRNAQRAKVPYMLVVGDQEREAGTAAVRLRSGRDLGPIALGDIVARLRDEVHARRDLPAEG